MVTSRAVVGSSAMISLGLLKDHGNLCAPDLAHLIHVHLQNVLAVEDHFSADNLARRVRDQAHEGEGAYTFPASAFADQAQGFPFFDIVGDTINGLYDTVHGEKVGLKVFDFKKWGHRISLCQEVVGPTELVSRLWFHV